MGIFSKVNEASGTQGGVYFRPGQYLVQINRVKLFETRTDGMAFIAETEVLESNNDELKVGSQPNLFILMKQDAALGNVADFCRAGLACKKAQEDGELIEDLMSIELTETLVEKDICGEKNILAGVVAEVSAFDKPLKRDPSKNFTVVKFSVPKELVAELRAKK